MQFRLPNSLGPLFIVATISVFCLGHAPIALAQFAFEPRPMTESLTFGVDQQPLEAVLIPKASSPLDPSTNSVPTLNPASDPSEVGLYSSGPAASGSAAPTSPPAAVPSETDPWSWIPDETWLPAAWCIWVVPEIWSGGLELGMNATEGNSEALSFRTGANLKRKTELWEFKTDLTYTKSTAHGLETQHNAIYNAGYERQITVDAWSHFGKLYVEYDEFKAFDLRLAMNAGFGRWLLKNDMASIKVRFGTGVSHETDSPDPRWLPEAVFGCDLHQQIDERQKLALTSDYFPEWGDLSNYRLVTDASWLVSLDSASKLSLKLSVNDRYDSTPNGRQPNDVTYAMLLLWQL